MRCWFGIINRARASILQEEKSSYIPMKLFTTLESQNNSIDASLVQEIRGYPYFESMESVGMRMFGCVPRLFSTKTKKVVSAIYFLFFLLVEPLQAISAFEEKGSPTRSNVLQLKSQ